MDRKWALQYRPACVVAQRQKGSRGILAVAGLATAADPTTETTTPSGSMSAAASAALAPMHKAVGCV